MRKLIVYNNNIDINYKDIEIMQINISKNQKEQKSHGNYSFPVNVSLEKIESYEHGSFLWHWHPEVELTWIMSGAIEYHVNEKTYHLKAGDILFGNSSTLHSGHMEDNQECTYLSITFHPRFLYGYENSILQMKYVDFITSNQMWSSLLVTEENDFYTDILNHVKNIYVISQTPPEDYELQIHIVMLQVWRKLYHYFSSLPEKEARSSLYFERLRTIISYIEEHYYQEISLEDIADIVSICKSECCRFFKKHMGITIFDYILLLRIQKSLPMLRDGENITKVAGAVGFSSPSYYSSIFKKYMRCTPREYKKGAVKNVGSNENNP